MRGSEGLTRKSPLSIIIPNSPTSTLAFAKGTQSSASNPQSCTTSTSSQELDPAHIRTTESDSSGALKVGLSTGDSALWKHQTEVTRKRQAQERGPAPRQLQDLDESSQNLPPMESPRYYQIDYLNHSSANAPTGLSEPMLSLASDVEEDLLWSVDFTHRGEPTSPQAMSEDMGIYSVDSFCKFSPNLSLSYSQGEFSYGGGQMRYSSSHTHTPKPSSLLSVGSRKEHLPQTLRSVGSSLSPPNLGPLLAPQEQEESSTTFPQRAPPAGCTSAFVGCGLGGFMFPKRPATLEDNRSWKEDVHPAKSSQSPSTPAGGRAHEKKKLSPRARLQENSPKHEQGGMDSPTVAFADLHAGQAEREPDVQKFTAQLSQVTSVLTIIDRVGDFSGRPNELAEDLVRSMASIYGRHINKPGFTSRRRGFVLPAEACAKPSDAEPEVSDRENLAEILLPSSTSFSHLVATAGQLARDEKEREELAAAAAVMSPGLSISGSTAQKLFPRAGPPPLPPNRSQTYVLGQQTSLPPTINPSPTSPQLCRSFSARDTAGLPSGGDQVSSTQVLAPQQLAGLWRADPYCLSEASSEKWQAAAGGFQSNVLEITYIHTAEQLQGISAAELLHFRALLSQLEQVDLASCSVDEKLAFWINLYNALVMHAFISYGVPDSVPKWISLLGKASCKIGRHAVNALEIEYVIMRGRSHQATLGKAIQVNRFPDGDKRSAWPLKEAVPLVSFALCSGTFSSPPLRLYKPETVRKQLESAKRDYLRAAVGVNQAGNIILPKLLRWYTPDIANDDRGLLEWVAHHLPPQQRMVLEARIPRARWHPLAWRVETLPYSWTFRYLINPHSFSKQT